MRRTRDEGAAVRRAAWLAALAQALAETERLADLIAHCRPANPEVAILLTQIGEIQAQVEIIQRAAAPSIWREAADTEWLAMLRPTVPLPDYVP
ncbi:MAG: hypothetical protein ABR588_09505 [Sphingomicrobium sp.]